MSKTDIKKGDEVVVIAGASKGRRGKISSYDRVAGRVVVEGLNLVKRHLKRTQDGQGGITEKEAGSLLVRLIQNEKVCCFEISEVNPTLDKENLMAENTFEILQRVVSQLTN